MRGGPWVKGMRGCGLMVGRNGSLFLGSRPNIFEEECPTGMTFHPKARFSDSDRSLNHKRERFKVFEVEPRSNRDRTVMTS